MPTVVKREPQSGRAGGRETRREPRIVKRERADTTTNNNKGDKGSSAGKGRGTSSTGSVPEQGMIERRVLRSRYLAVKNLINDEKDDMSRVDSDKFKSIISEVENLHQLVQKPREQVADAEALLDIANSLVTSVRSHSNEGVTPSDFINSLLENCLKQSGGLNVEEPRTSIDWGKIGLSVAYIFKKVPGCCTMLGPMNAELKQRKAYVRRKQVKPTENARPEELEGNTEEKTDTDKNMAIMFDILRKKRSVRLEHLILNRNSFAQTVENLFALSFLVKDGRVEITVDENGHHLVLPRNAPAANAIISREVSYSHFVFRLDFKDWKLMAEMVQIGDELMPHRTQPNTLTGSQEESFTIESEATGPTTPIRKLTRNRGLVLQEQVVEDSPENENEISKAAAIRKGKRKLQ